MSQDHYHLTDEELSAFLDHKLTYIQYQRCERHLDLCVDCQGQLADLQRITALLHALPPLELPRSFIITESMLQTSDLAEQVDEFIISTTLSGDTDHGLVSTIPVAADSHDDRHSEAYDPPAIIHIQGRRQSGQTQSYSGSGRQLRIALRIVGSLVATLGFFFLVTSLLPLVSITSSTFTVNIPQAQNKSGSTDIQNHSLEATTTGSQVKTRPAQVVAGSNTNVPSHSPTQEANRMVFPTILFFDLTTPEGRFGLGILLCIGGGILFTVLPRRKIVKDR